MAIAEHKLSALNKSGTVLGELTLEAAAKTGLSTGIKVVLGSFDHPGAARGTGTFVESEVLLSCGTSWVCFFPHSERTAIIEGQFLCDPFLVDDGMWGGMASIPCVGINIDWYVNHIITKEDVGCVQKLKNFDRYASEAEVGANGLFIDPVVDPEVESEKIARLCDGSPQDVSRAVMEGAAFRLRQQLDGLAAKGIDVSVIRMVGGPSKSPIWPQIMSDVTGVDIELINGQHAGAFGAAILAGIGVGIYKDEKSAFSSMDIAVERKTPNSKNMARYNQLYPQFLEKKEKFIE